jgi:hypothetical protein
MNKSSNLFVKAFYSVLIYGGYNCNIRLTCFYIIHDLRQDISGGWCREGAQALPPQFKMGKTGETNIINFLKEMYYCFVWILYTDVPM